MPSKKEKKQRPRYPKKPPKRRWHKDALDRGVSEKTGYSVKEVKTITSAFFREFMELIEVDDEVLIPSFGKFTLRQFVTTNDYKKNLRHLDQKGKKEPNKTSRALLLTIQKAAPFSQILRRKKKQDEQAQ